jgi:uncharacterized protein
MQAPGTPTSEPSRPAPLGGFELAVERFLYGSAWPARLAARLGYHPRVRNARYGIWTDVREGHRRLRIGYASDFHAGGATNPEVIDAACWELTAAAPDVLLLGGDFVGADAKAIHEVAPRLGEIPAPFGRFAVLGNHDWWTDARTVADALEVAGIQLLTNRNARLARPFEDVVVCGLDDPWAGHPDAAAAFARTDGVRIVLMHQPSGLLDVGDRPFALALCGHTHGGQIALPGGIPIVVPHGPLSRRYSRGRYELDGGRVLIVSRGVGCSTLPFRLFAPPEVVICDLELA